VGEKMKHKFTTIARTLRRSSTDAENLLWRRLRRKELAGHKFRRQQPVDNFIVDFICFEKRIVIEVDEGQHSIERDDERENYLTRNGFKVLRFWNNEVLQNIEGVLEEIERHF
jgi:very-short-patch-repair endonuclease